MVANDDFFADIQPAGAHKHGIIRRYPQVFAGKAGTHRRANGRVTFVDAYAGAGQYASGAPGSPMLFDKIAATVAKMSRNVDCIFVEGDKKHAARLAEITFEGSPPHIIPRRFAAVPGIEALVRDLAEREHASCGFMTFAISSTERAIVMDVAVIDDDIARAILDEFYDLPDTLAEGGDGLFARFAERGLQIVIGNDGVRRPANDSA